MPEVSRFYGITIRFYYRDHPPMHFHAKMLKNHSSRRNMTPAIFTKAAQKSY